MLYSDWRIIPGVLYRGGLEKSDYDEAIQALIDARDENPSISCGVCHDGGHISNQCHHNPLVMARRAISAADVWRCFHCNAIFTDPVEAEQHFGRNPHETPKCQQNTDCEANSEAPGCVGHSSQGRGGLGIDDPAAPASNPDFAYDPQADRNAKWLDPAPSALPDQKPGGDKS